MLGRSRRPFWFAILDRYSRLAFIKKPASGTVAVLAFLFLMPTAVYIVGAYPMMHKDQFKGLQKHEAGDEP